MKNIFKVGSFIIIFVMFFATITYAATGTVQLKLSKTQVEKGETFTVTVHATSNDGINGIDTKYIYDNDKLELISASVADAAKWSNLGVEQDITVICNTANKVTDADIYILTFKVRDTATEGSKIKIQTTDVLLDTDLASNSEVAIQALEAEVEVISNKEPEKDDPSKDPGVDDPSKNPEEDEPSKNPEADEPSKNPEAEEPSKDPEVDDPSKNTEEDDSSKNPGADEPSKNPETDNPQQTPQTEQQKEDNSKTQVGKLEENNNTLINSNKENATNSNKPLPYAGKNIYVIIFVIGLVIVSIVYISYKKYIKYKDIDKV